MGALKDEVIRFEEQFHDQLIEKFCAQYEAEWMEFLCEQYLLYEGGNE